MPDDTNEAVFLAVNGRRFALGPASGNDYDYDGCADCIVGEPHWCEKYAAEHNRPHPPEGVPDA